MKPLLLRSSCAIGAGKELPWFYGTQKFASVSLMPSIFSSITSNTLARLSNAKFHENTFTVLKLLHAYRLTKTAVRKLTRTFCNMSSWTRHKHGELVTSHGLCLPGSPTAVTTRCRCPAASLLRQQSSVQLSSFDIQANVWISDRMKSIYTYLCRAVVNMKEEVFKTFSYTRARTS